MADGRVTRRDFVRKGTAMGLAGTVVGSASTTSQAGDAALTVDQRVLPGGMPFGVIGDLKISRLIMGSNVPGAHSRDLIYVNAMGRAYNTPERMLDTYELAESQGINTTRRASGITLMPTWSGSESCFRCTYRPPKKPSAMISTKPKSTPWLST
jgi:hypothetical protein